MYAYLQYLTIGNLGVFARVLKGRFRSSISDAALKSLAANTDDAFTTQCNWAEVLRAPQNEARGKAGVPEVIWRRFAVRAAPGRRDLDESVFITADGHVRTGADARVRFPEVDLTRAPLDSLPPYSTLVTRIEMDWTTTSQFDGTWRSKIQSLEERTV
jgi:hypothetical protein